MNLWCFEAAGGMGGGSGVVAVLVSPQGAPALCWVSRSSFSQCPTENQRANCTKLGGKSSNSLIFCTWRFPLLMGVTLVDQTCNSELQYWFWLDQNDFTEFCHSPSPLVWLCGLQSGCTRLNSLPSCKAGPRLSQPLGWPVLLFPVLRRAGRSHPASPGFWAGQCSCLRV